MRDTVQDQVERELRHHIMSLPQVASRIVERAIREHEQDPASVRRATLLEAAERIENSGHVNRRMTARVLRAMADDVAPVGGER